MDEIADLGTTRMLAEASECFRCGAVIVRDEAGRWVRRDEPERGRGICRDNCAGPWLPHEPQADVVPAAGPGVSELAAATTQEEIWRQVEEAQARLQPFTAAEAASDEPAEGPIPDGVIGHLVAFAAAEDAPVAGTTHTTLMSLGEAQREADRHRGTFDQRWFPVEVRKVPSGGRSVSPSAEPAVKTETTEDAGH